VLLGAKAEAPVDQSQKRLEDTATKAEEGAPQQRRELVAAAGGQLLGAVVQFLGTLVHDEQPQAAPQNLVNEIRTRIGECVEEDPSGRPRLTFTLPDRSALDQLAQTLAGFLAMSKTSGDGA
jgi:hypothetical protein